AIDPRSDLAGLIGVRRLLRAIEPDVVHLHSSKAGVLGRVTAWSTGDAARVFYSPRGLSFLQEDYSPQARAWFQRIEWMMARLGGTVIACSASEEKLVRGRIRTAHVAMIENAVDVTAVPRHVERNDGIVRVGVAGRISHQRNSELFGE